MDLSRGLFAEVYVTIDELNTQTFSRPGASSGADEMSAGPLMTSVLRVGCNVLINRASVKVASRGVGQVIRERGPMDTSMFRLLSSN